MSYRNTLEAAIESLHDIEDLIKGFPDDGSIPAIELDLSLQKIRNLYELLLMFRIPAVQQPGPERTLMAESRPEPERKPVETMPEPERVIIVESRPEPERIVIVETNPEPEIPPVKPEPKATAGPVIVASVQAPVKSSTPGEARIISDRFKGRSTLHESLHQSLGKDGGTLAQSRPVSNLMMAIGINDRFTFIRELFNNDTPAFESTINILNEAVNFNDAYNYMIQHHDWDMDSDAVQLLLEIIRRKYITGRHE